MISSFLRQLLGPTRFPKVEGQAPSDKVSRKDKRFETPLKKAPKPKP